MSGEVTDQKVDTHDAEVSKADVNANAVDSSNDKASGSDNKEEKNGDDKKGMEKSAAVVEVTSSKAEELAATSTKKRGADRQITKDDREDDDNDNDSSKPLKYGEFEKASAETMATRRIIKVKRPVATAGNDTKKDTGSSNPFAATNLSSTSTSAAVPATLSSSTDATKPGSTSKVFGSSYKGFGSVNSGTPTFGSASSTSGFTFGSASKTSSTFIFGSKPDGDDKKEDGNKANTSTSTNLFALPAGGSSFGGGGGSSAFGNFSGLSSKASSTTEKSSSPVAKLPENVTLSTGEEEEQLVLELRCKSFRWNNEKSLSSEGPDANLDGADGDDKTKGDGNNNGDSATASTPVKKSAAHHPSVPPSEDFKKTEDEKSNGTTPGKDAKEGSNGTDVKKSDTSSQQQNLWQELGIGPLKVLKKQDDGHKVRLVQRRESAPNGPATKVILNLSLWKETKVENFAEKHVRLKTLGDQGTDWYLFKFKTHGEALDLISKLTQEISHTKSCVASAK